MQAETNFGICVAQLDGDVALKLVLEAHSLDTRDRFDCLTLAMLQVPCQKLAVCWQGTKCKLTAT